MAKTAEDLRIDGKDKRILEMLRRNARTPFLEMARELGVSGATVHERVRNLEKVGVIRGFSADIDYKRLGYGVTAVVSVVLEHPDLDLGRLREGISSIPEITEAHNLTGDADLLLTVRTRDMDGLRDLLTGRVQNLPGVRRMSTALVLDSPVKPRGPPL